MQTQFRLSDLIPSELVAESVSEGVDTIIVTARAVSPRGCCPRCGTASSRVHSRYIRRVSDLPCCGRRIEWRLTARRFVCTASHCLQKIFAERFGDSILPSRSRRTARLECLVHHLGLALGGRPAASFAKRLMLPVSNDTLLRVVRRRARVPMEPLAVVGVDDWAFQRNRRYGTIVCDLERHRIVKLLPDREVATVATFLETRRTIKVLSRDRGGGYREAAAKALPNALQVADRWHLMENASAAFLDAVRKSMRSIRATVGATMIDHELLTAAERLQYEGSVRREDANAAILALHHDGVPIKEIVRRLGHSRGLVRNVIRGLRSDIFRTRESTLDPFLSVLDEEWNRGCRNGAELWRRLKMRGFAGSLRVVTEWATRRRRAERTDVYLRKVPSARTIARMLTVGRDHLTKAETVTVAAIETGVPALNQAREIIDNFHGMIRTKDVAKLDPWLDPWIEVAGTNLVSSFARGVMRDRSAVRAAIVEPWSNAQTEGQVNRLKLVKHQMYGRAKIDLLEARLMGAICEGSASSEMRQNRKLTPRIASTAYVIPTAKINDRYGPSLSLRWM